MTTSKTETNNVRLHSDRACARLLAIDTSSEACSVALSDGQTTEQLIETEPRQHANLLLPMVKKLLSDADYSLQHLDAIACCTGPGAFTGIRIAVAAAQGLAFSADLPCIGVSSLATIAQAAYQKNIEAGSSDITNYDCAIDARMSEVYFGQYTIDRSGIAQLRHVEQAEQEEQVIPPEQVPVPNIANCIAAGNGWPVYADAMPTGYHQILSDCRAEAISMMPIAQSYWRLRQTVTAEALQPVYLRNKVAEKSKK